MTEMSKAYSVLKGCSLLRGLSPEWLEALAREARVARAVRGQVVFRQGEDCPGLYCVSEGLVRVFQISPAGKELVLHFAEPGQTFGEVAALGDFPAPANAQAVEDTLYVVVPAERLRQLLANHHELALQLLSGMALWVRRLVGLLEDIVLRDAAGRVARHLLRSSPDDSSAFHLPMLKKDLAAHLNLTSETLSRTLRRLVESGAIETTSDQQIRVLDRTVLEGVEAGTEG